MWLKAWGNVLSVIVRSSKRKRGRLELRLSIDDFSPKHA